MPPYPGKCQTDELSFEAPGLILAREANQSHKGPTRKVYRRTVSERLRACMYRLLNALHRRDPKTSGARQLQSAPRHEQVPEGRTSFLDLKTDSGVSDA
jgi:hypothetical protein